LSSPRWHSYGCYFSKNKQPTNYDPKGECAMHMTVMMKLKHALQKKKQAEVDDGAGAVVVVLSHHCSAVAHGNPSSPCVWADLFFL